ncbi:hypothetical protein EEL30_19350 [Brevibacillus laterosporus]|uniref:Uncharacterized protein n=1 Tax=Brevibacillus laterosporus TaxID=1465 RepID=A0A518VFQ2_BRELA|nr:hypothetical protein EEL30_19350 [Brevibacillus laterosporus]
MKRRKSEKLEGNPACFTNIKKIYRPKSIDNDYHYQYCIVRQTNTMHATRLTVPCMIPLRVHND